MFIKGKCAIYIDKNHRVNENSTFIFVLWPRVRDGYFYDHNVPSIDFISNRIWHLLLRKNQGNRHYQSVLWPFCHFTLKIPNNDLTHLFLWKCTQHLSSIKFKNAFNIFIKLYSKESTNLEIFEMVTTHILFSNLIFQHFTCLPQL